MIRVDLDNDMQVAITAKGLERAIEYRGQWEGTWTKRNYQTDRENLNFPAFVAQQSESLGAEVAVAKYFNKAVNLNGYKDKADVGTNLEVKWTKWRDGSLILRDHDRATDIAILVTGSMPRYYVCGWIPIRVARRPNSKRSDGSWWIGQQDLHPMVNFARSSYADKI
jgi:hypothetical protein